MRTVVRCDCWRDTVGRQRLDSANIPKRYQHCTIANFTAYNESLERAAIQAQKLAESFPAVGRGLFLEGRYKILPGLYAAARVDHLGFNRPRGMAVDWEAPVVRFEAGAGYHVRRNVLARAVYQHNRREDGRRRTLDVAAGQLLFWF